MVPLRWGSHAKGLLTIFTELMIEMKSDNEFSQSSNAIHRKWCSAMTLPALKSCFHE